MCNRDCEEEYGICCLCSKEDCPNYKCILRGDDVICDKQSAKYGKDTSLEDWIEEAIEGVDEELIEEEDLW